MSLTVILGALELGGIFAILSLGLYISYKVLNLADLTVDGSYTLGCAVSAVCTVASYPLLGLVFAFIAGCLAGIVTGILITKLKIIPILAGILTMTALYSVNLRVMGEIPTISLFDQRTIFTAFKGFEPFDKMIVIYIIVILLCLALHYFLRTHLGLSLRACGDNEDMVRASSIDTDKMKIIGLALGNGLVSLSGALFAQHQTFADINTGTGMMVIGLASIIIGLTFIKTDKIALQLLGVVFGAIFYRFALTIALKMGLPSGDLKMLSAAIVVIAIGASTLKRRKKKC